ncbi:hypothetical protein COCNU_01G002450 [Cocos nucifera]|uniref:Uncharacterized protein n=1 Tax=Cocos nucifera TaxID=13894 RepID=A0A8K0HTA2_COCNU|nr:hypothetical protein COCNU_01G002450 [Cocos nucifera]
MHKRKGKKNVGWKYQSIRRLSSATPPPFPWTRKSRFVGRGQSQSPTWRHGEPERERATKKESRVLARFSSNGKE